MWITSCSGSRHRQARSQRGGWPCDDFGGREGLWMRKRERVAKRSEEEEASPIDGGG